MIYYTLIEHSVQISHSSHYTAWSELFTFMLIVFKLLFKNSDESTAWHGIELIDHANQF